MAGCAGEAFPESPPAGAHSSLLNGAYSQARASGTAAQVWQRLSSGAACLNFLLLSGRSSFVTLLLGFSLALFFSLPFKLLPSLAGGSLPLLAQPSCPFCAGYCFQRFPLLLCLPSVPSSFCCLCSAVPSAAAAAPLWSLLLLLLLLLLKRGWLCNCMPCCYWQLHAANCYASISSLILIDGREI